MIGIIGAMSVEVEGLKARLEGAVTETVGGVEFTRGRLCGKEAVIAKCGIGKVFAALCAEAMIIRYAPDLIINTGVAGSLSEELEILDVAVSDGVVQHDMDTSPLGDPVGLISGINMVKLPASERLCGIVKEVGGEMGMKVLSGTIASGDQFIASPGKKREIKESFGAVGCEMEGAAIGQVCYVNSVEYVIIRAISDSFSGNGAMEYPEFVKRAAAQSEELVVRLAERL